MKPKRRGVTPTLPNIIIRCPHEDEEPPWAHRVPGHEGGSFHDAGYNTTGAGVFGFTEAWR